ncbi:MAG: 1-acyl-sn-glycerol-3-phosphate acyltransferase [Microbacteriaceae bacterium]|nr:1-acyl-sn-glycerol-3-phosphate acyltransferase [Microbacteriaceae bacterium]
MARSGRSEKTLWWRLLAGLVIAGLLALARYRMRGLERIPREGAFILTPNHYSDFDPLVSAYVLWRGERVPRFLAKASLFRVPVLGWLMRRTGQIPVERAGGGADPLLAARRLVSERLAVIIYPEGTLTRDPDLWPMRGKPGAARLALQHGIPVVPLATWGAQRVLPRWSKRISLFPRKDIETLVGEPVDLSRWAGRGSDPEAVAEASAAIMQAITALAEELRGETAPAKRWDPAEHGQSEFGRIEE